MPDGRTAEPGARVMVAVVGASAAQRELLSTLLARDARLRIACSLSADQAAEFLARDSVVDLLLGYADDQAECELFTELAGRFPDLVSVLLLNDPADVEASTGDAINAVVALKHAAHAAVVAQLHGAIDLARPAGTQLAAANTLDAEKLALLTEREREVLKLTAEGLAIKEIATRLHRGYGTVATHRDAIMRKLNLHDKVALARFAIRVGLVRA